MAVVLETSVIEAELSNLPGWTYANDAITKEFVYSDFREAVAFIVRLSFEAEQMNHHPELHNVYSRVTVTLTTHDADNRVTEKDIALASVIESISQNWN